MPTANVRLCEVAKGPPGTIGRAEVDERSPEANGLGAGVLISNRTQRISPTNVYDTRVRADCIERHGPARRPFDPHAFDAGDLLLFPDPPAVAACQGASRTG